MTTSKNENVMTMFMILLMHGCFISFLNLLLFGRVESRERPADLDENDASTIFSSTQTTLAICLSAFAFLIVVAVVIFKCADCYNSEVSSEFQQPGNGAGPKWGGAVGYSSGNNSSTAGGISFGEIVDPNSHQHLPYSMVPTNVPEHGGFSGYQPGQGTGGGGTTGSSMMGYQSYGNASAPVSGGGSRHYNPAEEQDQPSPPSYNEALRRSSFHQNS